MTAPQASQPQILPRPACTPAAIRAVLAANAGPCCAAALRRGLGCGVRAGPRARGPGAAGADGTALVVRGRCLARPRRPAAVPGAHGQLPHRRATAAWAAHGPAAGPRPVRRLTRVPVGAGRARAAGTRSPSARCTSARTARDWSHSSFTLPMTSCWSSGSSGPASEPALCVSCLVRGRRNRIDFHQYPPLSQARIWASTL
jgi:hypothetical protein